MHPVLRACTVGAAVLLLAGSAHAQQYGSAPSITPVGKTVAVSGGGVASGSVVSVKVTAPSGTVTVLATTADSQGKFSLGVTAAAAGMHRIEILASDNQRFADLRMMAAAAN